MGHARVWAVLFALALALPTTTALADIFRYVDANGVEHYTNIQPSGAVGSAS